MCATRWVERHDSILTFKELYAHILSTLEVLENDRDVSTSSKAASFSSACKRSDFLASLEITAHCFSLTVRLSKELQSPLIDLSMAFTFINNVLDNLAETRRLTDEKFDEIFESILKLAEIAGEEIKIPRLCGRQKQNTESMDPKTYFRSTIFEPFVDHLISELEYRFSGKMKDIIPLEGLIPKFLSKYSVEEVLKSAGLYESDQKTCSELEFKAEIYHWHKKWKSNAEIPGTALEALEQCDAQFFPNARILLQIFATIPVTTATTERTFSVLRRMKTYLRSTQTNERLNGLALANIHKDVEIKIDDIIKIFIALKPRRMQSINWSE